MKLLPTEPTREQLDAAHADLVRDGDIDTMLKAIYKAFYAAAPAAEVPGIDGVAWCQPKDVGARKWMIYFDDRDIGPCVYDDEEQARQAYERASIGYNCYLFSVAPDKHLDAAMIAELTQERDALRDSLDMVNANLSDEMKISDAYEAKTKGLEEQLKTMTAERNVATRNFKFKDEQCDVVCKENDQLRALLAAAQADAYRYRWLTRHAYIGECYTDHGKVMEVHNTDREVPDLDYTGYGREKVDAAIDADRG